MRLLLSLSALAATLALATPAFAQTAPATTTTPAQTSASAKAKGVVLQPLTLTWVTDLDFGTVIASGATGAPGDVIIDPDDGSRKVSGGVTAVANYPGGRATFQGAGQESQIVLVAVSALAQLDSASNTTDKVIVNGGKLTLDSGGATRTIDSTLAFTVGVGGDFKIAAGQPNGVYTGQFDVTADYQ